MKNYESAKASFITIFCTCRSLESAQKMASQLVEEQLIACANCIPQIESIYRWQGQVCHDSEALLILKTKATLFDSVKKRILELHDYEVPEIISLPISDGHPAYLNWILDSVIDTPPQTV